MLSSTIVDEAIPQSFILGQNYPNPFKKETDIIYCVPFTTHIILKVFTTGGDEIAKLLDEEKQAGTYKVKFNASQIKIPFGIYIYSLESAGCVIYKQMEFDGEDLILL